MKTLSPLLPAKNNLILKVFLFTTMVLVLVFSCGNPTRTEELNKMKNSLEDSFNNLSEKNDVLKEQIIKIINDTEILMSKKTKDDTHKAAKQWEKSWRTINNHKIELMEIINRLKDESVPYFKELRELETKTSDDNQRKRMEEFTNETEIYVTNMLAKMNDLLKKYEELLKESDNIETALQQSILLTSRSHEFILKLKRMRDEALLIHAQINNVTKKIPQYFSH